MRIDAQIVCPGRIFRRSPLRPDENIVIAVLDAHQRCLPNRTCLIALVSHRLQVTRCPAEWCLWCRRYFRIALPAHAPSLEGSEHTWPWAPSSEVGDLHYGLAKYVASRTTLLASSHTRHSRYT